MIKKLASWFLERLTLLFSREADEREIRAFVEKGYRQLAGSVNISDSVRADLHLLENHMTVLGWLPKTEAESSQEFLEINRDWQKYFNEGKVISKGGLIPGSGKALTALIEKSRGAPRTELVETMEKLLLHVEVKREKCLMKFTAEISPAQAWLERCDVSILFSRTARRWRDLRFLNAVFKLNDWYLKRIRLSSQNEVLARFLLALSEGEISAKELLA